MTGMLTEVLIASSLECVYTKETTSRKRGREMFPKIGLFVIK